MLKSIRFKIVITFLTLGMLGILALGITNIIELENLNNQIINNTNNVVEIMNGYTENMKVMTTAIIGTFIVVMIIVGSILAKVIISPVSNLVKSAEQATKKDRIKYLGDGTKKKVDINDLVNAFESMNNELLENLNEATRQSKQMETIMLHMTDGIIAFDIDGKIIHINPEEKTFLDLITHTYKQTVQDNAEDFQRQYWLLSKFVSLLKLKNIIIFA